MRDTAPISARPGCKTKFEADPEKYADGPPAPEPMPVGTQYTCPMHPEIVRDAPGSCPICGMALEPMGVPTGDEGPNPNWSTSRAGCGSAALLRCRCC